MPKQGTQNVKFCLFVESMTVHKLKALLQRIYKADPETMKLTYTSAEVSFIVPISIKVTEDDVNICEELFF